MPRTWIEISRDALRKNITGLKNILEPGVILCPAIKANAYGHDASIIAAICKEEGIDHVGVDSVAEAEEVREVGGMDMTIFTMGAQIPEEYERVVRVGAIQTVSSREDIYAYALAARRVGKPVQLTCEIETGLYRLGAQERIVRHMVQEAKAHAGWVYLQSIASHFASSEDAAAEWETKQQNTIFCDAITWLNEQGIHSPYRHIACSGSTILHPHMQHSLVRPGIMLYGLWPSPDVRRQGTLGKRNIQLTPVLSMKTHLVHIQDIPSGAAVGYGGSFKANHPMRIGVIPVGYYDGLDRRLGNRGHVIVRGTRCPIVGRICMNMCMIDIGGAPAGTRVGDVVTLIGRDGLAIITADEWAQMLDTIHYEAVTRISRHLPRIVV